MNSNGNKSTNSSKCSIGYQPARKIEQFSVFNIQHLLTVCIIICSIIFLTYGVHYLVNDFQSMQENHEKEIKKFEELLTEEIKFMRINHEKSMERIAKQHEMDIDQELQWFLEEVSLLKFVCMQISF